jgi:hypothetical protein
MNKKNNLKTLDQFIEEQYGKKGTSKREKFEEGFESFKLDFLFQQARLVKKHKRSSNFNITKNGRNCTWRTL